MGLNIKIYIIGIAVAVLLTTILSVGLVVAGKRSPKTKIGKIWPKLLIVVITIGVISSATLGFLASRANGAPPDGVGNNGETIVDGAFDFDSYMMNNRDDFSVELEYGEVFEPIYDSSELTLITEDIDIGKNAGEKTLSLLFQDNNEEFHTIQYRVIITDSHPPELKGVQDVHIDNGEPFNIGKLGITATDPVDGILEVQVDGDVNTNQDGIYSMEAYAADENLNRTSEKFFVIVGGGSDPNVFARPDDSTIVTPNPGDEGYNPDNPNVTDPVEKDPQDITEVAKEVIAGKYGVGVKRQYLLAKEGYNQNDVQDEVNRLVAEGYKPTTMYEPPTGDSVGTKNESTGNTTASNESKPSKDSVPNKFVDSKDEQEVKKQESAPKQETSEKLLELEDIAKLVIRGDYGNGQTRIDKLTSAGYDYNKVQTKVDSYKGILY